MKQLLYITALWCIVVTSTACKKEKPSDLSVQFFDRNTATLLDENPLNIEVSSDVIMTIAARGKSGAGLKLASVNAKVNGLSVREDKLDPNGENEYEVAQKLELDYATNAGSTLSYDFTFTDKNNQSKTVTANISFLANTFFSFRFLDFKSSDTLNAGDTLHLTPAYVPPLASNKVKSMKVYRKVGLADEELVKTYTGTDFFFYQVGFITQYDYPIPASLPSGAGIMHRFEMLNNQNARFVITHRTRIK